MTHPKFPFIILVILLGCSNKEIYDPVNYLSKDQQKNIIEKTIRYSAKIPPHSTQATKFDSKFDWYYANAANQCRLLYYYPTDSVNYFFITLSAISITPMKEGIGGIIKIDEQGKLQEYDEIFRTWKMPEDTLIKRGWFLFNRMIKGGDMTMYYSKFQNDRFIEFPDERTKFDNDKKMWIDTQLDSLNESLNPL